MGIDAGVRERTRRGIARHVATAAAEQELLGGVSARLQPAVPHATSAWLVTDPATVLFTDGWIEGFAAETCSAWFDNELHVPDVHKFASLGPSAPAVMSSLDDRSVSHRWSEIMRPQGLDDELRMAAADTTGTWATIELHREVDEPDFTPDEVALVADIGVVVAGGLRRLALERAALHDRRAEGPGLLHVHADESVEAVTEAGAAWLELLVPADRSHMHSSLNTLAALLRGDGGVEREGGQTRTRLRLRARDGRWVTLHGSSVLGTDTTAVIIEPARSSDVAELVARAYGLTDREQQVVLAIAGGASTNDVATALFLSPHTVRDHLKSAFAKVDVSSRTELVAALFDRHHAQGFFANVAG